MRLLIRADAGPRIGMGHWMRCLALAEAWRGPVAWMSRPASAALTAQLADLGIRHIVIPDNDEEERLIARASAEADWTVVDGYQFDSDYLERIGARRLLVVDDCAPLPRYECDLIVNPNPPAELLEYPPTRARLLRGSRYSMLRAELRGAPPREIARHATRILVTLGGSDPKGLTSRVIEVLPGDVDARIVIGPENTTWTHSHALPARVEIIHAPPRISELMNWADIAVAASGTVSLELAALGVPMILIAVADNQEPLARWLASRGAVIDVSGAIEGVRAAIADLIDDEKRRRRMSEVGRSVIDGHGVFRVIEAMETGYPSIP